MIKKTLGIGICALLILVTISMGCIDTEEESPTIRIRINDYRDDGYDEQLGNRDVGVNISIWNDGRVKLRIDKSEFVLVVSSGAKYTPRYYTEGEGPDVVTYISSVYIGAKDTTTIRMFYDLDNIAELDFIKCRGVRANF